MAVAWTEGERSRLDSMRGECRGEQREGVPRGGLGAQPVPLVEGASLTGMRQRRRPLWR